VDLIEADMTNVRLGRRFDLVILAFNSLLLLPTEAQRAATLKTIRDHLSIDGRAVIDVWIPADNDLELYDGRPTEDWVKTDPETGATVGKTTVATYDRARHRAKIVTAYEIRQRGQPKRHLERHDDVQFVVADALLEQMETAGLTPQSTYGGYEMADFSPESERLIVIAAPHRRT
jgi:hypothetical protein